MTPALNISIAVAVPRITTDFKALDDVGWYGSIYLLTLTALQPSFGKVYKKFHAKWTYLGSILIFEGEPQILPATTFLNIPRSLFPHICSWVGALCSGPFITSVHPWPCDSWVWSSWSDARDLTNHRLERTIGEKTTLFRNCRLRLWCSDMLRPNSWWCVHG